jgi:hypothetical protein
MRSKEPTLPAAVDHLLWGAPDLGGAIDALVAAAGVRAAPGGSHPELGTHNALAALGRRKCLELIAPDPALRAGALAHRLARLKTPTLLMWAARTEDARATAARAEAEGYQAAVVEGHRAAPDGSIVRWTNVFVSGHGAGTLVPFFIEWHGDSHPADGAPSGLHLRSFHAEAPESETLRVVLEALGVQLSVRHAAAPRLVAVLDTPRGRMELSGP